MQTDLLVIGAGPGGYRAAEYAAQQGLQVVIVEEAEVGGTCLNRGCIPTKTYVHSATFAEAVERQQQVVTQLRSGVESILAPPAITLLRGHAAFLDAHTVQVTPPPAAAPVLVCRDAIATDRTAAPPASAAPAPPAAAPVTTLTARAVIIATGSSAKLPPIPDIADPRVVTSTELLQLTAQPRRLAIIGAGVIGMEFASVFHRFGTEVTVIEFLKECLPMLDSDIAKRLRKLMEKQGVTFRMKTAVQQLSDIDADVILVATGRRPHTDGLNLAAAGIAADPRGFIPVDDNYQVVPPVSSEVTPLNANPSPLTTKEAPLTNPSPLTTEGTPLNAGEAPLTSIYAIGDVNGRQLLAHAAEMQAVRAVNHILGRTDGIRFDVMPAAVFTIPEAASVGPSEDQLKAAAADYRCRKAFWRANGKAMAMGETEGLLKLFSAPLSDGDERIIGCHAYGAHAADIIQEVSALMCRDTTVAQLRDIIHVHPTLGEILRSAVQ